VRRAVTAVQFRILRARLKNSGCVAIRQGGRFSLRVTNYDTPHQQWQVYPGTRDAHGGVNSAGLKWRKVFRINRRPTTEGHRKTRCPPQTLGRMSSSGSRPARPSGMRMRRITAWTNFQKSLAQKVVFPGRGTSRSTTRRFLLIAHGLI